MAKARMTKEESDAVIKNMAAKVDYIEDPEKPKRIPVKSIQLGLPSDLLGSKLSFTASNSMDLEATPLGVVMRSKKSMRKILISWANIKAAEFHWDGA